jgi:hypothetical protein
MVSCSAVIATKLGEAIDQINRERNMKSDSLPSERLLTVQCPKNRDQNGTHFRCDTVEEIENLRLLTADDLALLILLFQQLQRNMTEYDRLMDDLQYIVQSVELMNMRDPEHQRIDRLLSLFSKLLTASMHLEICLPYRRRDRPIY